MIPGQYPTDYYPSNQNRQFHRNDHPFHHSRSESVSSQTQNEQYAIDTGGSPNGNRDNRGSTHNISSLSDYTLSVSSSADLGERILRRHPSIESIERRTQKTYRYGIGLVCIGATFNWLGFAQGTTSIDPLRYLGVACLLTGSFCVCLAMCRWLSKPFETVQSLHANSLEEERNSGNVHVINVPVPMYVPTEYRPTKPPDYEEIVADENCLPNYDQALKLSTSEFFSTPTPSHQATLLEGEICNAISTPTPQPTPSCHHYYGSSSSGDPPPAYEPSPRPSISSCSSNAPLIPGSSFRFDLPPSFSVRRLLGGLNGERGNSNASNSSTPRESPINTNRRRDTQISNISQHLQDQVIDEDSTLFVVAEGEQQQSFHTSVQMGYSDFVNCNVSQDNI